MVRSGKWLPVLYLALFSTSLTALSDTTEISAVITDDIGCGMTVASVLKFTPQRTSDFQGAVTTHEIKPLQAVFTCTGKTGKLTPKITLQGNTPYNSDTVFLDGTPNSAGFMLRLSDGSPPSLSDFYDTGKAIQRGKQIALGPVSAENQYRTEETFLVGLVGPLDGPATAGAFSAALTFNLIFQ
ncbi:fimbrial protein [Morganella psychrotolerans]|uniref:Fimbrial protein n=1 Tax=Morganella psychrotolerans TaxID=368603 RepID=A0A1B8H7Y2_9GAMM|nr:fimbrial protein [Morganella psychrotolerans]OBU05183.1 fimbrial protein [Morganella psychrotolerans]